MFETQDMLPRAPPMPCAPLLTADTANMKPAVPEVSIIMGPPPKKPITTQETASSYAAWKKQVLPRVQYASNPQESNTREQGASQNSGFITTRSNVYPMRTKTVVLPQPEKAELVYRRSLEDAVQPQTVLSPRIQNIEHRRSVDSLQQTISIQRSQNERNEQRRSIDSLPQRNQAPDNVLTICASTQTDMAAFNAPTNELSQLMGAVRELQDGQRQMRQLLETFLIHQQQQQQQQQQTEPILTKVYCCEVATQCEILVESSEDTETLHQALPNVKIYGGNLKETPRAQSTTYRPSTPNNVKQVVGFTTPPTTTTNKYQNMQLPRPNTEKSMVMNELALKYLASDKINELLQDMAINSGSTGATTAATTTPLREIDNFNKAPVDISNASYKYLRKYRLLPDQNGTPSPSGGGQNANHSPYQQRLQDSPLIGANGSNSETENGTPHLDLEHIRRQPKFL